MDATSIEELAEIRGSVRALVEEWLGADKFQPSCDAWLRHYDLGFTRALADCGLIGISWPTEVGGGGRSGLARLVVTEELLRAGAPVAAHWIADRQIGPSILKHGSAAAKEKYLRGIASGEVTFCLGMSETESGSDLASVRTKAVRIEDGWSITGRKIWTSQGHRSTHAYVLARTNKGGSKHEGLSEFIVDMSDPGVEVRPIYDLRGEHHFNEVTFESVPVRDDHVIGTIGAGWDQVTAQLSLERGGIERVLSTYPLLSAAIETVSSRTAPLDNGEAVQIGEILARLATLRAMAFDVATAIDAGEEPIFEAAMLKDFGTGLEREINEMARYLLDAEADPTSGEVDGLLAQGVLAAPGFTIRGGTTEVLRTIVARGLSRTGEKVSRSANDLGGIVDEVLEDRGGEPADSPADLWETIRNLGWTAAGVPESAGGEGGDLVDTTTIVQGLGRHSVSLPVAETILYRRILAAAGKNVFDANAAASVVLPRKGEGILLSTKGRLSGRASRVPWGSTAGELLVFARTEAGEDVAVQVRAGTAGLRWTKGSNLAAEPRDTLDLHDIDVSEATIIEKPSIRNVSSEAALMRVVAMLGALETAFAETTAHVNTRVQFGKPLIKFQAVANLLATFASELESARVAVNRAVASAQSGELDAWTRVAAARVVAGRAATEGARIAHQLHGAMGVTREHPLHLSTRRLWSWRDEWGTQRASAARLGAEMVTAGPDGLWQWVTEQSTKGSS